LNIKLEDKEGGKSIREWKWRGRMNAKGEER
jgi:hypothetical protein